MSKTIAQLFADNPVSSFDGTELWELEAAGFSGATTSNSLKTYFQGSADYDNLSTYAQGYLQGRNLGNFESVSINFQGTDNLRTWASSAIRGVAEFTDDLPGLTLLPSAIYAVAFANPPSTGSVTRVRARDTDVIKLGTGNVDVMANDWIYWQNDVDNIDAGHGGGVISRGYWQNCWVQNNGATLTNWFGWFADGLFSAGAGTPTNGAIFACSEFIQGTPVDYARLGDADDPTIAFFRVDGNGALTWKPSASVSLGANGQFSLEATDNTHLTFKYRGSDGVTRSSVMVIA